MLVGMYHLPPNNAIGVITDLKRNDDVRQQIVQLDINLHTRDKATENAGQGPGIEYGDDQ